MMPLARFQGATEFLPEKRSIPEMQRAVDQCRGCDLYKNATQGVFGEGPTTARVVFVGEQPGNDEDLAGRPFVGPAGKMLAKALEEAGIDRKQVYVTNAVKHFKFEERGKRRIHKKPNTQEVSACQPWLEAEIETLKPDVVVCLGATAAQSLLGSKHRLTQERGNFVEHPWGPLVTSTIHPSAILRAPDSEQRHAEYARFVEDLRKVRERMR